MGEPDCVFCRMFEGIEPCTIVREWRDAIAIVPLNPVTEGHLLVIPEAHVADFTTNEYVAAMVMARASELAADLESCNLITSKGRAATQSVFHCHLHVIPRRENDGLALPWYSGRTSGNRT